MRASVFHLEDYRPFDAGSPNRCWHCGGSQNIEREPDEGGSAWVCRTCPHPANHSKTPECPTATCPKWTRG